MAAGADKMKNVKNVTPSVQQFHGRNLRRRDEWADLRSPVFANERVKRIISFLNTSSAFLRSQGKDHFFIEDDSPYFHWKHGIDAWKSFHEFCKFCITVTPDTTTSLRIKYKHVIEPSTVIAAPHPSSIHFQSKTQKMSQPCIHGHAAKDILVSSVGTGTYYTHISLLQSVDV